MAITKFEAESDFFLYKARVKFRKAVTSNFNQTVYVKVF